jgi:hypothetical protein
MDSPNLASSGVKRFSHIVAALLYLLTILLITPARATPAMVWSQSDAPSINIYYSPDGVRIQQITSAGINVFPNLFHAEMSTWLTWVDKTNRKANQLKYAQISSNDAVQETGTLPTVNEDLYAPSISIDPTGRRAWLVWAEYNGHSETLYASYLDIGMHESGAWKPALQITPDDQYSSDLPTIREALFDRARLSWMRTSPSSSESASVEIMARDWDSPTAARNSINSAAVRQAPHRLLTTRKVEGYDSFMKHSKKGQFPNKGLVLSPEEQNWSKLVHNRGALMGAAHSGAGASTRLADIQK